MKLYDFDKTIYSGDSALDFYIFSVRANPRLLVYLPYQAWHTLLFLLKVEGRTSFKSRFFSFLRGLNDVSGIVELFWASHQGKIQQWYLKSDHSGDVIISASPEFLLEPLCRRLNIQKILATKMDPVTGIIDGLNCYGLEKIRRFRENFANEEVEEAYSDHTSDMPMLELANRSFIVIGNRVLPMSEYLSTSKLKLFLMRLS